MNNSPIITSLLDIDWYKFTMGSYIHDESPCGNKEVTFKLFDRDSPKYNCSMKDLLEQIDMVQKLRFTPQEIHYLRAFPCFTERYLQFLANLELPHPQVLTEGLIIVKGPWKVVTYWETLLMSLVNELTTRERHQQIGKHLTSLEWAKMNINLFDKLHACGAQGIQFSDFGTRRRVSKEWQHFVVQTLVESKYDGFLGTSNVALSKEFGTAPVGTMAHELFMVETAMAMGQPTNEVHKVTENICTKWHYLNLPKIWLTDTYTSEFFFKHMNPFLIRSADGFRWDSGDPHKFTELVVKTLDKMGLDSLKYSIVYSDRMIVERMLKLKLMHSSRIQVKFGWGSDLTNPMFSTGLICKPVEVAGRPTVKLSDDPKKTLGERAQEYRKVFTTN